MGTLVRQLLVSEEKECWCFTTAPPRSKSSDSCLSTAIVLTRELETSSDGMWRRLECERGVEVNNQLYSILRRRMEFSLLRETISCDN